MPPPPVFTSFGAGAAQGSALDDPDAGDPFDILDQIDEEPEDLPPEDQEPQVPHEQAGGHWSQSWGGAQPAATCSWWDMVGSCITADQLKVGGAHIHHSHWLATFGNDAHRLVLCVRCGGTTSGASSPLLRAPCRHSMSDTRARQYQRMRRSHWPTQALQTAMGRGTMSVVLRFAPQSDGKLRIRREDH